MSARRDRVVVLGGGFGGLAAATGLRKTEVDVTIVDRRNHHLFQPLLYQVATAGLSSTDIAWPIRRLVRQQKNVTVMMDEIASIDRERRTVTLSRCRIGYDWLVVATGASHAYFGRDEWAQFAPGLKTLEDAQHIRRRVLCAFERAEAAGTAAERERLLTFLVIGGGPTGLEMAGAIAELAKRALAADFRRIDPRQTRVILVEAGPRLLPSFSPAMSGYAERALRRLGVEVRTGAPVTHINDHSATVGEDLIYAETLVWAAGVAASPAARWLGVEPATPAGHVAVGPDLRLPDDPRVFVIGDTARALDAGGRPLPGLAPVAKQQGRHAARVIAAELAGGPEQAPFRYRDRGKLATIGRRAAVIEYGQVRLKGPAAWWVWGIAHIYFLIGLRSRLLVAIQWLWLHVTFERGARLILGGPGRPATGESGQPGPPRTETF